MTTDEKFAEHLDRASEIVAGWPEWKQTILGGKPISKHKLINANCLDILKSMGPVDCIMADPPDNIGLGYNSYKDKLPSDEYMEFLAEVLDLSVLRANVVWWSFNSRHCFSVGRIFENLIRHYADSSRKLLGKAFIQNVTFGQNCKTDCGNGHRPLWRLMWDDAPLYPNQIKVPSWRQLNGDKRAAPGGRVPLDVWDFPRVTGNSKQRRSWHKTQLNEALVERALLLTTKESDRVVDLFGGTGTTLRVCKRINRDCTLIELDPFYCQKISEEHNLIVS